MILSKRHFPGDSARPAIGLHCMMGSAGLFSPLAERLSGMIDLQAFDFPGHGRSPDWRSGDNDNLHDFLTRYTTSMIRQPVDLIAHSFGATIALRVAVDTPHMIRSLTLVEPTLFAAVPPVVRQAEQDRVTRFLPEEDWDSMLRQFFTDWGAGKTLPSEGSQLERLRRQMKLVIDTNAVLMEDYPGILRKNGLEGISAPVMLITGENSPRIAHAISDALVTRLPNGDQKVVPDAAHMLPLTHPDQFAELTRLNLSRS